MLENKELENKIIESEVISNTSDITNELTNEDIHEFIQLCNEKAIKNIVSKSGIYEQIENAKKWNDNKNSYTKLKIIEK